MSEQREKDIDDIAKALRQVVSCNPQLLFRATAKCYGDLFLDAIKAEFEHKPKLVDALRFRAALCHMLGGALIRSGRASLEDSDFSNMALVMQLNREANEREAKS